MFLLYTLRGSIEKTSKSHYKLDMLFFACIIVPY